MQSSKDFHDEINMMKARKDAQDSIELIKRTIDEKPIVVEMIIQSQKNAKLYFRSNFSICSDRHIDLAIHLNFIEKTGNDAGFHVDYDDNCFNFS